MSISDEDKKRIEAEEEYRAKVRQELEGKTTLPSPQVTTAPDNTIRLSVYILLIIVVIAWVAQCLPSKQTPENKARKARQAETDKRNREHAYCNTDTITAMVMAEKLIKPTLKAPATAKFARPSDSTIVNIGDCTYQIKSYVDAQNSFGANLRNHFTATIKYTGNNNWRLLENTFH